jgi:hypothetical protein
MANKYFDNDRVRIKKREYEELVAKEHHYSIRRKCTIGDVKLTINWIGEFSADIPDEYCSTHEIHIENFVHGSWVKEPILEKNHFTYEVEADVAFVLLRDSLSKLKGFSIEMDMREVLKEEVDLSDYGLAPVSKNIPKTKGKNLGAW